MLLPKLAVWDSKISKFIKQQQASRLLKSQGMKRPLSKIFLVGHVLF